MGRDADSPFMLRVVPVHDRWREALGAVTHVNGTARVQTVDAERSPGLYEILSAFEARTGHPVLINTSLNVRGKPIVETPLQAVEMLLSTGLSALIIGDQILRRKQVERDDIGGTVVRLSPETRMKADWTKDRLQPVLTSRTQGVKDEALSKDVFDLLCEDAERCLDDRLPGLVGPRRTTAYDAIYQLVARALLLVRPGQGDSS